MQIEKVERRLAAILHADVQGYSRLISEDEPAILRLLSSHLEMMQALVRQHGGRPVGSRGDSLLAEFPSVVEAVQGAVEMQRELKIRNAEVPAERKVEFRMGINLGEIVVEGDQIHGEGINVAVRIEGLAEAGGICVSEMVYDQIKSRLALACEDLGEQVLKNIVKPVRVYRVIGPKAIATAQVRSNESARSLPLPDKPSIIVLPFINMSNDPEQDYFSDGITEDITTDLSKISSLFVISRNSAFTYKGKAAL